MKKSSARLSFLACILIVAALFILSQPTMSLTGGTNLNVVFEFEKALTLTVSDDEMYIENLLPGTSDNTNEITISVATNSETGFVMDAAIGDRLRPSTRISSVQNSDAYFSSVGINNNVNTIPSGSWGYSINHGATYSGLPDYRDVLPSDIFLESEFPGEVSVPFLVGATAAIDQELGIYYAPITFRAVTRPEVNTIDNIMYMQEIDEEIIASMKTEKQYQLLDQRDGKTYFIAKLKDGNVWMTQDLDFELYDGITLTPDLTDVKSNVTMPIVPLGGNEAYSNYDYYYDDYTYDPGEYYCPGGYCSTSTLVSLDNITTDDPANHYALGDYYSFYAATANYYPQCIKYDIDNNASSECRTQLNDQYNYSQSETSICPKGWTLPGALYGRSNVPTLGDLALALGSSYAETYYEFNMANKPMFYNTPGYYYVYSDNYSGSPYSSYAHHWTGTLSSSSSGFYHYIYAYTSSNYNSATNAYDYYISGGYMYSYQYSTSLYFLYPVRCVARTPSYTVEYYLNDGTSTEPFDTQTYAGKRDAAMEITPSSPERQGYTFLGWATSVQAVEPRYPAGSKINLTQYETKLYAIWERIDNSGAGNENSFGAALSRAGKTMTDGYYAMQDLDASICAEVAVGETTYLRDSRDGKIYQVLKVRLTPDGEYSTCWMRDDLRLGSKTESYTLTPEDSDVESDFVLPAVSQYTYTTWDDFPTTLTMDATDRVDENGTMLGYQYSYNLLTAGYYGDHRDEEGTSGSSICPKNWTLPRYYQNDSTNSMKQVADAITPTSLNNTSYSSTSSTTGVKEKFEHIISQFIKVRKYQYYWQDSLHESGPSNTSTSMYYATKDFRNNYAYSSYVSLSNIGFDTSESTNNVSFAVRCMIPVDYQLEAITIEYYPDNYAMNSQYIYQKAYVNKADPVYAVELNPNTNISKRPGYQLVGWSDQSGTSVPDYYEGDIIEIPKGTTNKTVYGSWRPLDMTNGFTFDDAFAAAGKTKYNGYYTMQDMTPKICDAVSDGQAGRLIDIRDDKVYWVVRLSSVIDTVHEGECWMTQNLSFELSLDASGTLLSPETSDVPEEMITRADPHEQDYPLYGYIDASDYYRVNGGLDASFQGVYFDALRTTESLEPDDEAWHYNLGGYYSWSAATGITNSSEITSAYRLTDVDSSICPKGWKLPNYSYNQPKARSFNELSYYILQSMNYPYNNKYYADPFYPVATGYISGLTEAISYEEYIQRMSNISGFLNNAYYWSSNVSSTRYPYLWYYYWGSADTTKLDTDLKYRYYSGYGNTSNSFYYLMPIRCVAR